MTVRLTLVRNSVLEDGVSAGVDGGLVFVEGCLRVCSYVCACAYVCVCVRVCMRRESIVVGRHVVLT